MVPRSTLILSLLLFGCSEPRAIPERHAPASWDPSRFEALRAGYMEALDDRGSDETGVAIEMEKKLSAEVEQVRRLIAGGALPEGQRGAAGLLLIYDALLLSRDTQHAELGRIDARRLYAREPGEESRLRRRQVVELLDTARTLRPDDGRIASWIAGSAALAGRDDRGQLTDEGKQQLLDAIEVAPTFNLWTAFIVLRNEPLDTPAAETLFAKTRAFLDSRKCRDVQPGTPEARNCQSGPLAPHNSQAATVMLGDQYLHRGESALRRGAIPEAMPLLGTARGIYGSLSGDHLRESTAAWRNAPLLEARLQRLAALAPGRPLPDEEFWRSRQFGDVYDCASCHAK